MALHRGSGKDSGKAVHDANPFLGAANPARAEAIAAPRDRLPDGPVEPEVAYQLIHDELLLDGSARLNLATFVTTWMEPQARTLMAECVDKNHDRQGRVPADSRTGASLRVDARRSVERARRAGGNGMFDHRFE